MFIAIDICVALVEINDLIIFILERIMFNKSTPDSYHFIVTAVRLFMMKKINKWYVNSMFYTPSILCKQKKKKKRNQKNVHGQNITIVTC